MRHSKSSLFLMELIIAIFFFSLASAVCIQLFANAHTVSRQTVNENHAVMQAQNLAETYLALEGDLQQMAPLFESSVPDFTHNKLTLYFDTDWLPTTETEAYFRGELQANPLGENGLITADIIIAEHTASPAKELFRLQVSHHIAERRGNLE